jgi:hypothetical protein
VKKFFILALVFSILVVLLSPIAVVAVKAYTGIPTFTIVSVEQDKTVTIKTHNFPAGENFTVTMGAFGTLGIGGVVVQTTNSGSGGAFTVSYSIPAALAGSYRIAIRLQSSSSGYYAYNWFYNNTTGAVNTPDPVKTPVPGYSGFPWFKIESVIKDSSVTIQAYNFPPNDTFQVLMGAYGTLGVGGISVGTTKTDGGGSFTATYSIPAALAGSYRIAIRFQSPTSGYYAYNWFYNNTTGSSSTPSPTVVTGYSGYPWFQIQAVAKDASVTIKAYNFPTNDTFQVLMGAYGTYAVGGVVVDTVTTDGGGSFTGTFSIPAALAGSNRIAIRLQSSLTGYYAYNWFYNNSTP